MLVNIIVVDSTSPHLPAVKALWRANSDTLGFFPDGAFNEHAAKRHILVALAEGQCVGYLLYRVSRQALRGRISIVHLCVDQNRRGLGIAKTLVDTLHDQTPEYDGIGLSCRRDYAASRIWPQLGFTAIYERPGRGHGASELTYWWLSRNHPNLWTTTDADGPEARITAVIDANVFFDLRSQEGEKGEESKALLADWLRETVELCITSELRNEINRNPTQVQRSDLRYFADSFREVSSEKATEDAVAERLRKYFPTNLKQSDESDLRQVARTIAADVQFFITRDGPLLERSEDIYKEFQLRLMRPSDLIIRLDELRREAEYQPVSLAATSLNVRLAGGDDPTILTAFQNPDLRERRDGFQSRLRRFLASPRRFSCRLTEGEDKQPLSLVVCDTQVDDELIIPMFRVGRTKLAPTLARYHVRLYLLQCAAEGRLFIKIIDPFLASDVKAALREEGFATVDGEWIKVVLPLAEDAARLGSEIDKLAARGDKEALFCRGIHTRLMEPGATADHQTMAEVERLLWPAKVMDAALPSFIVPIQPQWAQDLFDTNLARQTLFGANQVLALSREAVYYRSAQPKILTAPSRVLWYVSQSSSYEGSKSLRACSQIVEVVIDKPKKLYRRFQRLGIYEWTHVYDLAKRDIEHDLMAIRFRNTELFPTPIPYRELTQLLREQGHPTQIQSPHRIPSEVFAMLYKSATEKAVITSKEASR